MNIASNIRNIIENQGITIVKFCELVGITSAAFYKQMRTNNFNISTLERYAKALNIPLWQLFVTPDEVIEYINIKNNNQNNITNNIICPCCKSKLKIDMKIIEQ